MERYDRLGEIGAGMYGVVFRARDTRHNTIVALKQMRVEAPDEGIPATTIREISLLKELRHSKIVRLDDVVHTDGALTLVFECLDQDLKRYLDSRADLTTGLDSVLVKSFLFQLIVGIAYCHKNRVLHRDLKPQNLLINDAGELKLADFGLARAFGIPVRSYTHEVVTLWYRAPELLMGARNYTTSVDMWSVGVIFAEMVTGVPLFRGESEDTQLETIFRKLGTPNQTTYPGINELPDWRSDLPYHEAQPLASMVGGGLDVHGLNLLSRMLLYDPVQRIKACEALTGPYFDDIPEELRRIVNE